MIKNKNEEVRRVESEKTKVDVIYKDWINCYNQYRGQTKNTFNVVISGIQNSGKSTLANILIGDYSNSTFKVGDYRVTTSNKEYDTSEGITFIDTPGYGTTTDIDTKACINAWKKANIVLFLHSVESGGADLAIEIEMLKNLVDLVPNSKDRILLVFTKNSEKDLEAAKKITESFLDKVRTSLQIDLEFINIESSWFLQSITNEKVSQKLLDMSKIDEVKKWIQKNRKLKSISEELFEKEKKVYLETLKKVLHEKESELKKIEESKIKINSTIERKIESKLSVISGLLGKCIDLKKELKEMKKSLKTLKE